jgi:hypothetical protein
LRKVKGKSVMQLESVAVLAVSVCSFLSHINREVILVANRNRLV